jgi:hypothetical protein
MKRAIVGFILIGLSLLVKSCNTTEPPVEKAELLLKLEDISCTEAWIELTTTNLQLPATLTLKQTNPTGDTKSQILNLNTKDSLLYIDSLLPNKNYQYQVSCIQNPVISNELNITTMDTTSHNFTWQQFTFGEHNPSTLYDVAIVGEEIWAVGAIYMKDSLGNNDPIPYNAIYWDGSEWELKRIPSIICGSNTIIYSTLFAIFIVGQNDILFSDGGETIHWDGQNYTNDCGVNSLLTGQINKIWGISSNNFYVAGNKGSIARYKNGLWTKLESGTDVDLLDVWGSPDGSFVWACGYYRSGYGTYLLRSTGSNFEMAYDGTANEFKILQDTISGAMTSVYTPYDKRIFVCSTSGVYNSPSNTNGGGKRLSFTPGQFPGLPYKIRGNGVNDFTIVGEYSFIGHYNGYGWRYFDELWTDDISLLSVAQKGNLVVAVGYQYLLPYYNPAVIFVGRR